MSKQEAGFAGYLATDSPSGASAFVKTENTPKCRACRLAPSIPSHRPLKWRTGSAILKSPEKWQELKREPAPSGYANVRVHDLKHTFGHRLEAAGTTFGDCQVLLGHRPRTVTQRYMVAEIVRLIEAAERVLETSVARPCR